MVKNLPKDVTRDSLREHFSRKGEVTDAKPMRTTLSSSSSSYVWFCACLDMCRDGKSRQFAFIGFRTEEEAQEAIKYFNRSYINTYRISCEIALEAGHPNIPQPWSRHSIKNKDEAAKGGKRVLKKNLKKTSESDDPQLQKFLQVMQPRTKSKLWANDTLVASIDYSNESGNGKHTQAKKNNKEKSTEAKVDDNRPDEAESQGCADPSSSSTNDKDGHWNLAGFFEEELEEFFSKFGKSAKAHVVVDKRTRLSKGFAYIQYALPESASRIKQFNFPGRRLHVFPAKQKFAHKKQDDLAPKTFKQRWKEDRRASEASADTKTWNRLFMHPDRVVENILRKYGISKSDFLDREADDLAVSIALGEAQGIAETKKALADAGVNIASLKEGASRRTEGLERSNHVLLVKNLPYGSSRAELTKMFGKFGSVVFLEPSEARAAFDGLAYKQYKDAPLYLEYAPENVLDSIFETEGKNKTVGAQDAKRALLEQEKGLLDVDGDPDRIEKLSFKTSDEALKRHCSEKMKEGRILKARILRFLYKKHMNNGKPSGFGFIEFDSKETAANIYQTLQVSLFLFVLDKFLSLKKDERVLNKADKHRSSTKLHVKNVAFEATKKDLEKLFSPFGKIKRVSLPRKYGNQKGYAFVECVTKQEGRNALQALANSHLYGRHLVLHARTAARFNDENGYSTAKLSKKRKQHMAVSDQDKMMFKRIAAG
ncbi:hypothetical protein ACJRO7_007242 [Eucalyptus globulus]|uniref:RRM domain-containing protein n=1 Tax=Eucalyptus globulus TaxID=34317 RepID=A0ABD3ILJ8_EUCGL